MDSLAAWDIPQGVTATQCSTLTISIWWDAAPPVDAFNSMTAVLTEEGSGIANADSTIGGTETVSWETGQRRADQRSITIPCDLPAGDYPLLIGLYTVNAGPSVLVPVTYEDGISIGDYFLSDHHYHHE